MRCSSIIIWANAGTFNLGHMMAGINFSNRDMGIGLFTRGWSSVCGKSAEGVEGTTSSEPSPATSTVPEMALLSRASCGRGENIA